MKLERMLSIIVLLLNRRKITAQELAQRYEVSIRTIYRDIETINSAGIPIIPYKGYNGGLCIMENYKLNHQLLSFEDMIAILTALNGVNATLGSVDYENTIAKIDNLIPLGEKTRAQSLSEFFIVDMNPWFEWKIIKEKIQLIYKAISTNQMIQFKYTNNNGITSSRTIEPMTLINKYFSWYVFGFCLKRNEARNFKLTRIKDLKLSRDSFKRRDISYTSHMNVSVNDSSHITLQLLFSGSINVKVEESFEPESITYLDTGDLMVEINVPEDEWLLSFILSFGEHVTVIKPKTMAKKIQKKAQKILNLY